MGLFDSFSNNGQADEEEVDIIFDEKRCPRCGSRMHGDGERYECPICGVLFLVDGEYLTPDERARALRGNNPCPNCGGSRRDAGVTLPWEEGNPDAYIKCPHCGYVEFLDGYGEDD